MPDQYLYNSAGEWIAFREGRYVFSPNGQWIGWMPWDDCHVVTIQGQYLGTIVESDRLYRYVTRPDIASAPYPGSPSSPGFPGYPGRQHPAPLPPEAQDVVLP